MGNMINLAEKFALFNDQWSPKIIANIDDYDVRLVRIEGEFEWHSHLDADEMFLVVEGEFRMEFRDRSERLCSGEMIVVPKGTEHRPVANQGEAKVVVFEKSSVLNTGDGEVTARSVEQMERI